MDATVPLMQAALVRLAEHLAGDRDGKKLSESSLVDHDALQDDEGRLTELVRGCELTPTEVDLFVVAAAVHLDRDFGTLFATAGHEPGATRPAVALALELVGCSPWDQDARRMVDETGALRRHRLIQVHDPDLPLLFRHLEVPERVVRHLLGDDEPDQIVTHARVPLVPVQPVGAGDIARALLGGVELVYLREPPRASARALAASAAVAAGTSALGIDLARVRSEDLDKTIEAAIGEAVLSDAILVIGPADATNVDARRLQLLGDAPCPVVLHGRDALAENGPVQYQLRIDVEPLDRAGRSEVWRTVLTGCDIECPDDVDSLAAVPLAPERVLHAALVAQSHALAGDHDVNVVDLAKAAASQTDGRLETLARLIRPEVRFEDLVVADRVHDELGRLVGRLRHQELVRSKWGLDAVVGRSRGVTALFAGPSGTGKTMSAEALAGELGVELYVVDLSTIVDKYIGETEKNLERVFTAAESHSGVLFFDEADALFGKRSEVRDAHDRFANIEVAYLLQRIELFDGIAVLATNLRSNLDDAFLRRLDAVVTYDEPDQAARLALWERHLPPALPRADDVDLDLLATAVPLTGGLIRNVCLDAAFCAADDGGAVSMAHLVRSAARSQRMAGRLMDSGAFGSWSAVLDD